MALSKEALKQPLLVFGEIVWDVFPDARRLGGAPLNFAYYFKAAGGAPRVVSAVGEDGLGREVLDEVRSLGLGTEYVARNRLPTGTVVISRQGGRTFFKVVRNTAWEEIPLPLTLFQDELAGSYVGTLTRISEYNRKGMGLLLDHLKGKPVCLDINLRKSWINRDDIDLMLGRATHLKMNNSEALLLLKMGFTEGKRMEEKLEKLLARYGNIGHACITLGANGSIGMSRQEGRAIRKKGTPAKPGGDPVGAGDAFTGYWFYSLLAGKTMEEALAEGNRIGSIVAGIKGAIAVL